MEGADGHLEASIAAVDEDDVSGRLIGGRQILLVDAVGQCGGSGLVEEAQHVEAGNARRVEQSLALGLCEVRRHGDDAVVNCRLERRHRYFLQLSEQHRCDLLGREHVLLVEVLYLLGGTDMTLRLAVCLSGVEGSMNCCLRLEKSLFSNMVFFVENIFS